MSQIPEILTPYNFMKIQTHGFDDKSVKIGLGAEPTTGSWAHDEHDVTSGHRSYASKLVSFEFWPHIIGKEIVSVRFGATTPPRFFPGPGYMVSTDQHLDKVSSSPYQFRR